MSAPAPDVAAPGARLAFRPDIEGLRAIAILLVVGAHAGVAWLRGGVVGVDVFFVLSGFLITGLLVAEWRDTGRVRLVDFYARRLRRLLPALLAMLVVASLAAAWLLAPHEQDDQAAAAAAAAAWVSNLLFALVDLDYFGPVAETNAFLHTWSLGVEEQFYLFWPAGLLALMWTARGAPATLPRRLAWVLGAIAVVGFAITASATATHPRAAFYMMPARAWQFALGALAWIATERATVTQREGAALGVLGLALVALAATWIDPAQRPYPGWAAALPSLGAALVLVAGKLAPGAGAGAWLARAPLPAIGRVSYAWYLWHWPVLLLAVAYFESPRAWVPWAAMALALALAFASSRWIEGPVRRHAGLAARPWLVVGLAALATAGVVAGALAWRTSSQRWDLSMAQRGILQVRQDLPAPYRFKCDEGYLGDRVRPCVFGEEEATRTVVLVGDSIGIQWFPAVAALFDQPGWRVVVLTKSACPMVDAPLFYARIGREYGECARWRARAVAWIAQQRPELVFVGSANTYALTPEQWAIGSDRVLGALAGRARRVFVLRATPHLPFDAAACVARRQWRGDAAGGCAAPAVSAGPVADAAVQLAAQRHGIAVLDLDAAVCPGGRCAARRDGVMVYRDSHHVTASYAETLAPALLAAMQDAGWHDDRAAQPAR